MNVKSAGKPAALPQDAFVNVTWRCNSRCIMCDVWKKEPGEELAPSDYARLPRSLKFVNVSGGEPFLRDDLPQIIEAIHRATAAEISVSTNGFATERIVRLMGEVLKQKIKCKTRVVVSLDGISDRHDGVRGVKGSFDRAMSTIESLQTAGIRDLSIAYTATNSNVDQLRPVMELARKLKVQFTFAAVAHVSSLTFAAANRKIEDMDELKNQLDYLTRVHLKSPNPRDWGRAYVDSGHHHYALTGRRSIPCHAGADFFFMAPDGEIYPDMILDYRLGNIRSQDFAAIWHSPRAGEFRNKMKDVGNCSSQCWMLCTVFPHMRRNKAACIAWLAENKLRAHLGMSLRPVQG